MNDDELPLSRELASAELASAYLDGALGAAERAAAAADPGVMALVDSFARVRAAISDVKPTVYSTRTAAIAAALAEFDARHAADDGSPDIAPAAIVTSLQSRRMRSYRILTGVAAAALVGVVAVAALNSGGNRGNDLSSTAATEAPAAGAADSPTAKSTDVDSAAGDTFAIAAAEAAPTALGVPAIDSEEALAQYATGFEAVAAPAADAATTGAPSIAADDAAGGGSDRLPTCVTSDQIVLGAIVFQGTSAYAVRDSSSGELQAIAFDDCRVLAEVPAP